MKKVKKGTKKKGTAAAPPKKAFGSATAYAATKVPKTSGKGA